MRYKIFLFIALISLAVYANSLSNGFVYDDEFYVSENSHIRDISNIPASFIHPEYMTSLGHKSHYRPLVMISYTINYWIGGLNPAVYRVTNLLFHVGTAFMLFLTVEAIFSSREQLAVNSKQSAVSSKQIADSRFKDFSAHSSLLTVHYIALTSALIFAVHPFNSEAVNYITARSSLISGFFYLLAFYCWVKYRQSAVKSKQLTVNSEQLAVNSEQSTVSWFKGFSAHYSLLTVYYFASILAFVLGVLSKEAAVTLPLALFLYDIYFRKSSLRRWVTYVSYLPFFLLIIIALIIRSVHEGGGFIPYFRRDIATQIFTGMPVLTGYLKLLLLPAGLTIAHDVDIYTSPFEFSVIISAIILFVFIVTALYLYWRRDVEWRLISFFMIWYFITLLVVIIMPLNRIMQENRCYISGLVFAVFIGVATGKLLYVNNRHKLAYGILALLMIIYGVGTAYRNTVWINNATLWADAMEKSPYEPLVYNNLSVAYKDIGEYEKAKEVLYRGIRLSPNEWLYHYNLAILYKINGELEYALLEYDRALLLKPELMSAKVGKGGIYLEIGEVGKGIAIFQDVINRRPEHALAHYYMAKAFDRLGRKEEARDRLELAVNYAGKASDWQLVRRIQKYKDEGFVERESAVEDFISPP